MTHKTKNNLPKSTRIKEKLQELDVGAIVDIDSTGHQITLEFTDPEDYATSLVVSLYTKDALDQMRAATIEEERSSRDNAYWERNQLVALVSKLYPSHLARHPDSDTTWEDDWRTIICVHSPAGQLTWHIHDNHRKYFEHLNKKSEQFADCKWDGHTTQQKYRRIRNIPRMIVLHAKKITALQGEKK